MNLTTRRRPEAARTILGLASLAVSLAALLATARPALASNAATAAPPACACGCGLFDTDSSTLFPQGQGGRVYLEYDWNNQHENWSGLSRSPGWKNADKQIETHWLTLGAQYMFSADWGVQLDVPYAVRDFVSAADDGTRLQAHWNDFGDIRVRGIYDGFFEDHSGGLTFGFKLPSGNYSFEDKNRIVDRDTEIGTGSVDVLIGGFYHRALNETFTLFTTMNLDVPAIDRDHYHPGMELDLSAGTILTFPLGELVKLRPVAQVLFAGRTSDSGKATPDRTMSGYERILVAPGLQVDLGPVSLFGDVAAPVFQHVLGQQLVAPFQIKFAISYRF